MRTALLAALVLVAVVAVSAQYGTAKGKYVIMHLYAPTQVNKVYTNYRSEYVLAGILYSCFCRIIL